MNTGQMLMVLGALMLLSLVALTVNSMIVNKTSTMLEVEAHLDAVSLGQSMLDEILTQSYDAVTAAGTQVFDSTGFTAAGSLGPNGTEATSVPLPEPPDTAVAYKSLKYYNDVDDYNGYKRLAYTTSMGTFSIIDSVFYVQESDPSQKSAMQTFYKKVVVTIRHKNMYPTGTAYDQWAGKYYLQVSDVAVYRRYF
jgi:hypothetical protein